MEQHFQRQEIKYVMDQNTYKRFLNEIAAYIEPDPYPQYPVYSIYYDTKDFDLIQKSLDKPKFKLKVRLRSYLPPSQHLIYYLEIKKKWEQIVYKSRIVMDQQAIEDFEHRQLPTFQQTARELKYLMHHYDLKRKVYIGYYRQSFMAKNELDIRITFDTNIHYRFADLHMEDRQEDHVLPIEVMMEIKAMQRYPRWLLDALKKVELQPTSFSKYGTIYQERSSL